MKVQVISDVHLEFHPDGGKEFIERLPLVGDVLAICGDFATYRELTIRLMELCKRAEKKGVDVVFVCGNHEFYSTHRGDINNKLTKVGHRCSNFHWLNNRVVEIKGQRFVGTTMWFDPSTPTAIMYRHRLNDFKLIRGFPRWIAEVHEKCVSFLRKEVQKGDVVLTHHAPYWESCAPAYRGNDINCYYVCDQSRLIREREPALWCHGHMHNSSDYPLWNTRIVANPHGYMGKDYDHRNGSFSDTLVIDLEDKDSLNEQVQKSESQG